MILALVSHLTIDAIRERAALIAELLFLRHENAVLRRRRGTRIDLTKVLSA